MKYGWDVDRSLHIALGAFIVIIFLIVLNAICNGQDYTGRLPQNYDAQKVQNKFDVLWNYIRGSMFIDAGKVVPIDTQHFDTVYTNIKYDTIISVVLTLDTIYGSSYDQNLAMTEIISDSSFQIQRRLASEGYPDTIYWMVAGRIKLNF